MPFGITPAYLGAFHSTQNLKKNPRISFGTSNGTDYFGLVRQEYSGPALKAVAPFHLTKSPLFWILLYVQRAVAWVGYYRSIGHVEFRKYLCVASEKTGWDGERREVKEKSAGERKREGSTVPSPLSPIPSLLPFLPFPTLLCWVREVFCRMRRGGSVHERRSRENKPLAQSALIYRARWTLTLSLICQSNRRSRDPINKLIQK